MFGFSPSKILFTAIVIALIWYGFRWYARFQANQMDAEGRKPVGGGRPGGPKGAAEDMIRCETCGSYVVAGQTRACGKEGCPFPG